MKLREIAQQLESEYRGDGDIEITGVAPIEEAAAGQITFIANPKYARFLATTQASALIVPAPYADQVPLPSVLHENPYLAFARTLRMFYQPPRVPVGIHPTAVVSPKAKLGADAAIGPFCVVDDDVVVGDRCQLHGSVHLYPGVHIGDDFTAHSHVVIREFCRVGDRVLIQNHATIGADGFGFAPRGDGTHEKIPQTGIVVIGDDVEIQCHSCVDRATLGETRIERGTKIDNLVQVGHASVVGENSILCGQAGLAGSTKLGKNVTIAGQVGLSGHLELGDRVVVTAQSGVGNDVPADTVVSGFHARERQAWLKAIAVFWKLPELYQDVKKLKRRSE